MRRLGSAAGVLAAAVLVLAPASGVEASHGPNLWSGQWATSTGGFALRLFLPGDLKIAQTEPRRVQLWNKLPCKSGPQLYRGGYNNPDDRGKIMGCGTPTHLRGRWYSNDFPDAHGSFDITIKGRSPLRFKGTAAADGGKSFAWTGTWKSHFGDDGCCKGGTAKPPRSGGSTCRRPAGVNAAIDAAASNCKVVSYEMPERFGPLGANGLVAYMNQATSVQIAPARWPVVLTVHECDTNAVYEWTVDGKPVNTRRLGKCRWEIEFRKEDEYSVKFKAQGPHGTESTGFRQVLVQDWLIVGIGDSLSSGEGNIETTKSGSRVWRPRRCHRSAASWQARVALTVEPRPEGKRDPETSVTFVHLGCSGASITEGLLGGYAGIVPESTRLAAQVDELKRLTNGREIDAVLVSIGVNEFAFGDVAYFCAANFRPYCPDNQWAPGPPALTLAQFIAGRIAALPGLYARVNDALRPVVSPDRVYITEYPDFLHGPGGICDEVLDDATSFPGPDISANEAQWLFDNALVPLNDAVRGTKSLKPLGWKVVEGPQQTFRNHGYCAPADRWIVTYTDSMREQATAHGALHPNEAGHNRIAAVARELVARDFYPGGLTRKPR